MVLLGCQGSIVRKVFSVAHSIFLPNIEKVGVGVML
jgi:hypothetical protein